VSSNSGILFFALGGSNIPVVVSRKEAVAQALFPLLMDLAGRTPSTGLLSMVENMWWKAVVGVRIPLGFKKMPQVVELVTLLAEGADTPVWLDPNAYMDQPNCDADYVCDEKGYWRLSNDYVSKLSEMLGASGRVVITNDRNDFQPLITARAETASDYLATKLHSDLMPPMPGDISAFKCNSEKATAEIICGLYSDREAIQAILTHHQLIGCVRGQQQVNALAKMGDVIYHVRVCPTERNEYLGLVSRVDGSILEIASNRSQPKCPTP